MKKLLFNIAVIYFMLPPIVEAATYRWVDTKGVVHYSNSIPAKDAQLGHVELNDNAIKTKVVLSAKQKREMKRLEEEQKTQKLLAEKKRKEKAKQEEEEIRLLSIFSSEAEVVNSYNSKLRMAQLTIDLLKSRHKKQSDRLAILEKKQEKTTNIDHRYELSKQIDETLDNLKIYQQAITENIIEKDRVHKEFKTTLNRFKKLSARQHARQN